MQRSTGLRRRARRRWDLLFIALPLMIFVVLFSYIPLFGWYLSLIEYKVGQPILGSKFVGLSYFQMLFSSRDMARVMKNTIVFSVLDTFALVLPPLFAILLNELKTLPHFISWIIVYSIFYALFTTEGIVNQVLALFGKSQKLLIDKNSVYGFQTFIWIWKNIGWKSIIYVAAIAGIDQELYEAATVDGANRFQCALHVTIPGIMPTFIVMMLLGVADFLNHGLDQYFVFENPLVSKTIETLELYTYKKGIMLMDYSYATAIGIFQSAVSIILLMFTNWFAKRVRGEAII